MSVGSGPSSRSPSASPRSTAGRMIRCSSSPNRPPSPPCGFSAQTPIRGARDLSAGAMKRSASRALASDRRPRSSASKTLRSAVCSVTWTTARPAGDRICVVGPQVEHHREVVDAAQLGQQLGVAGIVVPGPVQRLLVQRRGGDRVDLAGQRQPRRPRHGVVGRLAAAGVERARRRRPARRRGRRGCTESRRATAGPLPGDSISTTATSVCQSSTARRRSSGMSDDHRPAASWTTVSVQAPTMISGPMPAGSPSVTAISGFCLRLSAIRLL